jgi:hypothetical protein
MFTLAQPRERGKPDDVDISLRLKYGRHTILIFADPLARFSEITDQLLSVLRQRYPDGLRGSHLSNEVTMRVPAEGQQCHVAYAALKVPSDHSQGWKNLQITGDEKPVDKNIKNNAVLAFVLQDSDDANSQPKFHVEWPSLDDD